MYGSSNSSRFSYKPYKEIPPKAHLVIILPKHIHIIHYYTFYYFPFFLLLSRILIIFSSSYSFFFYFRSSFTSFYFLLWHGLMFNHDEKCCTIKTTILHDCLLAAGCYLDRYKAAAIRHWCLCYYHADLSSYHLNSQS
jgi:hypothetical protein